MFEIGDIVRLKTGGPDMVVEKYQQDQHQLQCSWYEEDEKVLAVFSESSLEKAGHTHFSEFF